MAAWWSLLSALVFLCVPVVSSDASLDTGCAEHKMDLVFILDSSTSVTEKNYELMKDFVKDFLNEADLDNDLVRVGVVTYSTEVTVEFQMNSYTSKADVSKAIDDLPYRYGGTNTADALLKMRSNMYTQDNGDRSNVENICIVVTDGVSNINARRVLAEAEQARADGIHIYAIGIGLTDTRELDGIASKPVKENRFTVQEFSELKDLRHKVISALCSTDATLVTTTSPPPLVKRAAGDENASVNTVEKRQFNNPFFSRHYQPWNQGQHQYPPSHPWGQPQYQRGPQRRPQGQAHQGRHHNRPHYPQRRRHRHRESFDNDVDDADEGEYNGRRY